MKASIDNLIRLGRLEEAEKVRALYCVQELLPRQHAPLSSFFGQVLRLSLAETFRLRSGHLLEYSNSVHSTTAHSFALALSFQMTRVGFHQSDCNKPLSSVAPQVRKKLEPLEKGFWAKALAENGFREQTRTEKDKLLGAQQAELGSLSQALRRYVCVA